MNINDNANIANLLLTLNLEDEEDLKKITLSVHFVRRDKTKDDFYFSKSIEIEPKLSSFLKKQIISNLSDLRSDNGENKEFRVSEYHNEFTLTDVLGSYKIKKEEVEEENGEQPLISMPEKDILVERVGLLKKAIQLDSLEQLKMANFQIVTLEYNKKKISFCFYRSIKKVAKTKRYAILESKEYKEVKDDLIELGGSFSFFFDKDYMYIIKVRDFENAFDYKDHISIKSQKNLKEISEMGFFKDKNSSLNFVKKSKNQLFARGLAQINEDTMRDLKMYYAARVKELEQIQSKLNKIKDDEKKKQFEEQIGDLKPLLEFFNFETEEIIFSEESNPKPLLHFFQDKIVSSFLTKKVRTVMSY